MAHTDVATDQLLLTANQVAQLLNISRTTVYELVKAGKLEEVHIGRSGRFRHAEVVRFAASLGVPPTKPDTASAKRRRSGRRRPAANQDELFTLPHDDVPEAS